MIDRRVLEAQLVELDEERASTRAQLAAFDRVVARLAAEAEQARAPEEDYLAQRRRCNDELAHLMGMHGCRVVDSGAGNVIVVAGRIAVSRDVERRLVALVNAIRTLDSDRELYLKSGGVPVATAQHRLERCQIDRAVVAARLAALGG